MTPQIPEAVLTHSHQVQSLACPFRACREKVVPSRRRSWSGLRSQGAEEEGAGDTHSEAPQVCTEGGGRERGGHFCPRGGQEGLPGHMTLELGTKYE